MACASPVGQRTRSQLSQSCLHRKPGMCMPAAMHVQSCVYLSPELAGIPAHVASHQLEAMHGHLPLLHQGIGMGQPPCIHPLHIQTLDSSTLGIIP